MTSICGADCANCGMNKTCRGCIETAGHPFGGDCIAAKCYENGGKTCFEAYKAQLIEEFNTLCIPDMPKVTELYLLAGSYINLEYTFPGGVKAKLLDDTKVYLGGQLEKPDSDRCFGFAADDTCLFVCEYGCNGNDPELVIYKRRN